MRPLLAGIVRWEEDAAIVALGRTGVRVQGDVAALRAILGGCDGRSTVAERVELRATRRYRLAGRLAPPLDRLRGARRG